VPSIAGGVLSLIVLVVMLLYSSLKLTKLVKRANPNISSYVEEGAISTDEKMNLKDIGIRFAFGVEGYLD